MPNPSVRLSAGQALEHKWINPTGVEMIEMARRSGNQPLIDMLTRSGTVNISDVDKLRLAAPGGHLGFVQCLLARHKKEKLIDAGSVEKAALVGAAAGGHDQVVAALLKGVQYPKRSQGADVYKLACQRALEGRHFDVVNLLWPLVLSNRFVNRKYPVDDRAYPLMIAVAAYGEHAMLREVVSLLGYRVRPDCATGIRADMIKAAARHGNIDNLYTLMSPRDNRGERDSALLEAAIHGQLPVVKHLLKEGDVDLTLPLPLGQDAPVEDVLSHALAKAATRGHLDVLKYLCERGIAPTHVAINAAATYDHTACFQFLVRVLRETEKWEFNKLFTYIATSGIPHWTLELLNSHPDPESLLDHVGRAARLGHVDVVRWLLGKGARVADALGGAAEAGQMDVVQEVLCMGGTELDLDSAMKKAMAAGQWTAVTRLEMEREGGQYQRGVG